MAVTVADGIALWDLRPESLARAACTKAGRNITEEEWETYMGAFGDYLKTCPQLDWGAPGPLRCGTLSR